MINLIGRSKLKKPLREIKFVIGSCASGKSHRLLEDYCRISNEKKCAFISFEGDLIKRIPIENINACANYIKCNNADIDVWELIEKINSFVKKENIECVFLDAAYVVTKKPYDLNTWFSIATKINCSVYMSQQIQRNTNIH